MACGKCIRGWGGAKCTRNPQGMLECISHSNIFENKNWQMQNLYTGNNCGTQILKPKLILVTFHIISLNPVVIKYLLEVGVVQTGCNIGFLLGLRLWKSLEAAVKGKLKAAVSLSGRVTEMPNLKETEVK